jgi:Tfp pilus assembly protein PilF
MSTDSSDNSDNVTEAVIVQAEAAAIEPMQALFMAAMEHRQVGHAKKAESCLLEILKNEPRLPEPHLELAHIYHGMELLEEAKTHIDQAVQFLENGGQWLDLPENEILAMAYLIQGEIYRSLADLDEVVFGDQAVYVDYVNRAKNAFTKANHLDSSSVEYSGSIREWQWDQQIEDSINQVISSNTDSAASEAALESSQSEEE